MWDLLGRCCPLVDAISCRSGTFHHKFCHCSLPVSFPQWQLDTLTLHHFSLKGCPLALMRLVVNELHTFYITVITAPQGQSAKAGCYDAFCDYILNHFKIVISDTSRCCEALCRCCKEMYTIAVSRQVQAEVHCAYSRYTICIIMAQCIMRWLLRESSRRWYQWLKICWGI